MAEQKVIQLTREQAIEELTPDAEAYDLQNCALEGPNSLTDLLYKFRLQPGVQYSVGYAYGQD